MRIKQTLAIFTLKDHENLSPISFGDAGVKAFRRINALWEHPGITVVRRISDSEERLIFPIPRPQGKHKCATLHHNASTTTTPRSDRLLLILWGICRGGDLDSTQSINVLCTPSS
ncbi:hypothetical protein TcG_11223 [Trypanosoma cruzi]|nr:hypothetical protein TcG_11223 [Trypanosoma cruzi]